jgi:ribosomal protein RSM22 (predicted rRNA methylase)
MPFAPSYPDHWSQWWARKATAHFHLKDDVSAVRRLTDTARRLSDLFTTNRAEGFEQAYDQPLPILAYGNYFFPQTYVRMRCVLEELEKARGWNPPATLRVADLGSGSGAASCAVLDAMEGRRCHLELHDQSGLNLRFFKEMIQAAGPTPSPSLQLEQGDFRDPKRLSGSYDLILVSFSLGEAWSDDAPEELADWIEAISTFLTPTGLLIILEPALESTTRRLHGARDLILPKGKLHVHAPCLHALRCPLMAKGGHWCHEVRNWDVPVNVNRINNGLRRSVWDLKFSFLVLGPTPTRPVTPGPGHFRLVSPVRKQTGRVQLHGCAAHGHATNYDLLRRHIKPEQLRQLEKMERGTLLQVTTLEVLGGEENYRIPSPEALQPFSQPV